MSFINDKEVSRLLKFVKHKNLNKYANIQIEYKLQYYRLVNELIKDASNSIWFIEYKNNLLYRLGLGNETDDDYNLFKKEYNKNKKLFTNFLKVKYCNIYSAILEAGFILSLKNNFDIRNWLQVIGVNLELKDRLIRWFIQYFETIKDGEFNKLKKHCKQSSIPNLLQCVHFMNKIISEILKLESFPNKHIAVISTMSSGKSTFINALIGNEILPETQGVCTAKITSIYDNDAFEDVSGFAFHNQDISHFKIKVNKETARDWNDNDDIDRIIYEGNLKKIPNSNQIVVIHDTPGTNFSSILEHQKITIDFLNSTKLDTIICLINAMYIGTNDSKDIVEKVYKISQDTGAKIVFVLNKIDTFDTQKESIKNALDKTKFFLQSIGFQNPILIKTSAKAVRMFRMALEKNSKYFTEDEEDDFKLFFRKFSKNNNIKYNNNTKIKIGDEEYFKNDINNALRNTNFHKIEQIIKQQGEKK